MGELIKYVIHLIVTVFTMAFDRWGVAGAGAIIVAFVFINVATLNKLIEGDAKSTAEHLMKNGAPAKVAYGKQYMAVGNRNCAVEAILIALFFFLIFVSGMMTIP